MSIDLVTAAGLSHQIFHRKGRRERRALSDLNNVAFTVLSGDKNIKGFSHDPLWRIAPLVF
jgi:hypothetical protein